MKKGFVVILIFFMLLGFTAFAESNSDIKVIDDNSSIYSDFAILGLNPDDYYPVFDETKPENLEHYDHFDKWYIIAMAENYVEQENQIQTYFYLYSPIPHQYQESGPYYLRNIQSLTYKLNGKEDECLQIRLIDHNDRGIIKIKGFSYAYTPTAEIELKEMVLYCCLKSKKVTTSFKATSTHTQTDGFMINLYFNSTLIIDEMESVSVRIPPHSQTLLDGFFSFWENTLWQNVVLGQISDLYLTFYNFNFPNNIQPDTIDYAKFNYDIITSHTIMRNGITTLDETNQERVSNEYFPGTKTFQNNKYSVELDFDVFVLGNRIDKGEFGYIDFSEEEKRKFDYDASILLDSYATGIKNTVVNIDGLGMIPITETKDVSIENIEFLELWYTKDDVQYRCQIVSEPINPDIINPGVKKEWWEQIFEVFRIVGAWVLELFNLSAPSFVQTVVGAVVCFIGVLLIPAIVRFLINFISSIINIIF